MNMDETGVITVGLRLVALTVSVADAARRFEGTDL